MMMADAAAEHLMKDIKMSLHTVVSRLLQQKYITKKGKKEKTKNGLQYEVVFFKSNTAELWFKPKD